MQLPTQMLHYTAAQTGSGFDIQQPLQIFSGQFLKQLRPQLR
jgi:hypothetical protein